MAGFKLKVTPEMEALTEICVANRLTVPCIQSMT